MVDIVVDVIVYVIVYVIVDIIIDIIISVIIDVIIDIIVNHIYPVFTKLSQVFNILGPAGLDPPIRPIIIFKLYKISA